jgi:hypothetical protein
MSLIGQEYRAFCRKNNGPKEIAIKCPSFGRSDLGVLNFERRVILFYV